MHKFTSKQKKAVKKIGFGGLLSLPVTRLDKTMMPWLIRNFDPVSWIFVIVHGEGLYS